MRLHGALRVLGAVLLVLLTGHQQCVSATYTPPEAIENNGTMFAACKMRPSSTLPEGLLKVSGQVLFRQVEHEELAILLRINGFPKEGDQGPRAVHIHQYGDLSQGCDSTGGHYNPKEVNHPNHPGDFGNFVPHQGKISAMITSQATLFGGESVIGRAVVIHEKVDDLGLGGDAGSLLHGNAGRRLGCCIIGISSPKLWNMQHKQFTRRLKRN
ncbi:extracellular superoxide dismutase [Cu-Zn]-like [Cheilinus undulatus]|uniref:extracellular superoxide dismutase [Cu-Zn]-like n=1 Tax=Cheilinus undulatus TaxID=241271 RepID=UPI001BD1CF0D|nr:extracellular superoxide dismutase [Cu-Zn]-like [Cheilinus undulatus]